MPEPTTLTEPESLCPCPDFTLTHSGSVAVKTRPIWALVPAKSLALAKSRLSGVLDEGQRARLAANLLRHTLGVLQEVVANQTLQGIVVLSADREVLNLADRQGALPLFEPPLSISDANDRLNAALSRAVKTLAARYEGVEGAVLILPADLPFLTAPALQTFLELDRPGQAALATDRHCQGTNGLLLDLATARNFRFQFGNRSLRRHYRALETVGLTCTVYRQSALANDLDNPRDFAALPPALRQSLLQNLQDLQD